MSTEIAVYSCIRCPHAQLHSSPCHTCTGLALEHEFVPTNEAGYALHRSCELCVMAWLDAAPPRKWRELLGEHHPLAELLVFDKEYWLEGVEVWRAGHIALHVDTDGWRADFEDGDFETVVVPTPLEALTELAGLIDRLMTALGEAWRLLGGHILDSRGRG